FPMQYDETDDGTAKIKSFEPILEDKSLVRIEANWFAINSRYDIEVPLAEEVVNPTKYVEGATKKISVNAYERCPKARAACINHYGCSCYICGFDFLQTYGEIGEGFIHVHHERAL